MGNFILFLTAFNIIIGDVKAGYSELSVVFFLGFSLLICCHLFRRKLTLPIENEHNAKWIAKRKLLFLFLVSVFSGIAYYLLYQWVCRFIFHYSDTNLYKQIFVAILFGAYSGIFSVEYLWGKISILCKYKNNIYEVPEFSGILRACMKKIKVHK
jgi:drug/metabolite transporter (DMT)-like permease